MKIESAVWKWLLPLEVEFTFDMPVGAEILTVQTQFARGPAELGVLWARVDPNAPTEPRRFQMVGTGPLELPANASYLGTYQLGGGSFVAHIFEILPGDGKIVLESRE